MAIQKTQKLQCPVQHKKCSYQWKIATWTNTHKPWKLQGKCYQCGKPGHRVWDCGVKFNSGKGAMQGRAKLHAALGKQEDELNNSAAAQWLIALKEKLGEIVTNLQTKNE